MPHSRLRRPALTVLALALFALPGAAASAAPLPEAEPNDTATSQAMLGGQQWTGSATTDNDIDSWRLYVGPGTHQVRFAVTRTDPVNDPETGNPHNMLWAITDALGTDPDDVWIHHLAFDYADEGSSATVAYSLRGPGLYYLQGTPYISPGFGQPRITDPLSYTIDVDGADLLARPSCLRQAAAVSKAKRALTRARKAYRRKHTASRRRAVRNDEGRLRVARRAVTRCKAG